MFETNVVRRRLIVSSAVCAVACASPTGPIVSPPDDVRFAPVTATLAGQTLTLETYLYRDFQPSSPRDGKPLIAGVRVRATSGGPVDPGVRPETIWVIHGEKAWTAPAIEEHQRENALYVEAVARKGPKWGPGVHVDVVLRLRDATGASALIRAPRQLIGRTD